MIHRLHNNTQCSSQQVPSSMPITHFPLSPLHPPSVCFLYLRVSYGLPSSLFETIFSPSLPPWSSVKFLKVQVCVTCVPLSHYRRGLFPSCMTTGVKVLPGIKTSKQRGFHTIEDLEANPLHLITGYWSAS